MIFYFKEIFTLIPTQDKYRFFLLVFLLFLCAILETIGIGIVLPFMAILLDENFAEKYTFVQKLLEFFSINSQEELIIYFLCFFLIIYLLKSILIMVTTWVQHSFIVFFEQYLRRKLFIKYLSNSYSFFLRKNSANIMRNLSAISQLLDGFLNPLISILAEFLVIFTITILLLYNAFQSGISLIIFFSITVYLFQLFTKHKLRYWGGVMLDLSAKSVKNIHESIYGIKQIKIFGKEKYFINDFKLLGEKSAIVKRNKSFFSQLPRIWIELISAFGLSFLIYFLIIHKKNISDAISIIAIFVVSAFRLMPSANRLLNSLNEVRGNLVAAKLITEEFKARNSTTPNISDSNITFNKYIKLTNIAFKYPNTNKNVLKNVNLTIKKGSCIGFIGKSGAGKSTLVDIIIGLFQATSGEIRVDDKIINPSSKSWQRIIGYVSQNIFLTDDTIKKNIAFGLTDEQIDNNLLNYSLHASQLYQFVKSLPNNINTFVGEHGVRLSGGQRQRIALARALYINPSILIFDEATSSLDPKTEIEIMKSINDLKGQRTILIISHRLSTLDNCDEIYEIKDGEILLK